MPCSDTLMSSRQLDSVQTFQTKLLHHRKEQSSHCSIVYYLTLKSYVYYLTLQQKFSYNLISRNIIAPRLLGGKEILLTTIRK